MKLFNACAANFSRLSSPCGWKLLSVHALIISGLPYLSPCQAGSLTSFSVVASFNPILNGGVPDASLTLGSDGNYYGTCAQGGSYGDGTVFKLTPSGTLTTLVNFAGANGSAPEAALIQGANGNFYGTTSSGGSSGYGTIFEVTPAGTLTTLVNFDGTKGSGPEAGLVQSGGNFYGTTQAVGGNSATLFEITPSGIFSTITNLPNGASGLIVGGDGRFYGTSSSGNGSVFALTPAGTLSTLFSFAGSNGKSPAPQSGVIRSGAQESSAPRLLYTSIASGLSWRAIENS